MFGPLKIAERGFSQRFAFQRHNSLIAFHICALVDREGHVPLITQKCDAGFSQAQGLVQLLGFELRETAQTPAGRVIGHKRINRAATMQLQNETTVKFQHCAQHGSENQRLTQHYVDGFGIVMRRQNFPDNTIEPNHAAIDVLPFHAKRQGQIVVFDSGAR